MALGMPLLLSDIASFREQCEDTAVYFNLKDSNDFITKLLALILPFLENKSIAKTKNSLLE